MVFLTFFVGTSTWALAGEGITMTYIARLWKYRFNRGL
jgi:hypothetical protein